MKDLEVDNAAGVIIDKSFSITGTLTPTSGVIELTDKIITLASSASGTARVASVGGSFDYSGGGKFIVQRYVPARRAWRLFTAPVTNSNTIFESWQNEGVYAPGRGTLITGPAGSAFGFDAATAGSIKEWDLSGQVPVNLNSTHTNVSPGINGSADNTGYFIFIRGDRNTANFTIPNTNVTTLSSAGQLQTGPQTFTAISTAGKYTLIGNPYASPIEFNNISRTNLVKRFVVWDPLLNTVGAYVTLDDIDGDGAFSSSVGGSSQTSELLSHQAFFVETAAAGAAAITINESDKTDGGTYSISRPTASSAKSLAISLYLVNTDNSTVLADGVKAEFDDRFSTEVTSEDAVKFVNINETFSLTRNSSSLAMERRPVPFAADTLYLRIAKTAQRNYQLLFNPLNLDVFSGTAFVKDSYSGTETAISLSDVTVLDFTVNADPASQAVNRFAIVFRPFGTLPVRFTSVSAYKQLQHIAVEWKVENESGILKYELEKSSNGRSFTMVSEIEVTTVNNSTAQYSWLDRNAAASANFYRVKSIERNGHLTYSEVVQVSGEDGNNSIAVSPNPLQNNTINLQFRNQASGNYTVRLMNNNGQLIYQTGIKITGNSVSQAVSVPETLGKGIYQVEVRGPGNTRMLQQVIVQ